MRIAPRRTRGLVCALTALVAFTAVQPGGAQAPAAAPDVAHGRHVATAIAGCTDCHGATFAGGRVFVRDGSEIRAANLTSGAGGIAAVSDADVARAIRAGIAPDGSRLAIMPKDYAVMTDRDVADVIAFLRALPPVDNVIGRPRAAVSAAAGGDAAVPGRADATPAPGAYIARLGGCTNCHGVDLAGGRAIEGVAVPNIGRAGLATWAFADFRTAMRSGMTPDGRMLAAVMPWRRAGRMTDDELRSLYDYLQSVPGTGSR